jgi:hypothetical protein
VADAAVAKGNGRLPQPQRNNPRPARVMTIPASRATRGNGVHAIQIGHVEGQAKKAGLVCLHVHVLTVAFAGSVPGQSNHCFVVSWWL